MTSRPGWTSGRELAVNKLATFNAFGDSSFKNLHVGLMRRTEPWDLIWEGVHWTSALAIERYEELKTWVNDVKALRGGTGKPTLFFDRCSGKWVNPFKAEQIECATTPELHSPGVTDSCATPAGSGRLDRRAHCPAPDVWRVVEITAGSSAHKSSRGERRWNEGRWLV